MTTIPQSLRPGRTPSRRRASRRQALERGVAGELGRLRGSRAPRSRSARLQSRADRVLERVKRLT